MKKTDENVSLVFVAIRTDPLIGRGTCSVIDECWTDEQLKMAVSARIHKDRNVLSAVRYWRGENYDLYYDMFGRAFAPPDEE